MTYSGHGTAADAFDDVILVTVYNFKDWYALTVGDAVITPGALGSTTPVTVAVFAGGDDRRGGQSGQ